MSNRETNFTINSSSALYTNLQLAYLGRTPNGTTIYDESPNAYNGTGVDLVDSDWSADAELGRQVLTLNGSSKCVSIGNRANLKGLGVFTIAGWNYNTAAAATIFSNYLDADNYWRVAALDVSGSKMNCYGKTATVFQGLGWATVSNLSAWQHFCFTYDTDNKIRSYINGVLKETSSAVDINWGVNANFDWGRYIGSSGPPGTFNNGILADLMVWDRVLTTDEITTISSKTDIYMGDLINPPVTIIPPVRVATFSKPNKYPLTKSQRFPTYEGNRVL